MHGVVRFWWPLAVLLVVSVAAVAPRATLTFQGPAMDTYVFRTIARQQNPAVVAIVTTTWRDAASREDAEWFERFFGRTLPRGAQAQREIASGFLISHDGDILTNEHVVADADVIEVRLMGRETTTYAATVVGRDPVSDSALIRLKDGPPDLPVAILGDSDALQTGDWVMAIGNPFQLGHSVSVGVVSYAGRTFGMDQGHWQKLIQTDASINPGNSGGPLLNVRGEVVGMNVAVLADGIGDSMGIGFAVPINNIKAVLAGLRAGRVVRGSIGVQLRMSLLTDHDATALGLPRAAGALITSIEKPSTADAAGLHAGDVIVEFLGLPIVSAGDFLARVSRTSPGVRARVAVIRDGHTRTLDVEVDTLSSPAPRRESHRVERPDLGLTLADRAPSARGAIDGPLVQQIQDGSVAADAGIEKGDVVRRVNQRTTRTAAEAMHELRRMPRGSTAFLLIWRDEEEILVEMPTE
jgi:serine protease Do